jgi:hypothetical protein
MPNLLALGIYLLLLSSDDDGKWWNRFLHNDSIKDKADNYGVSNFTGLTTWKPLFPDDDIKVEMMSPPWNNFLRSLSVLSWLDLAMMKN